MHKWIWYSVLAITLIVGWTLFMTAGEGEIEQIRAEIQEINERGYQEEMERISGLKDEIENIRSGKTLNGILLAFLTAGLVGVIFVIDILPMIAHKFTHAVYDSGEEVDEDVMHDARAKLAQGEYDEAIAAFRDAADADPTNRLPWVEIAKIQRDHYHDGKAAVETLKEAIEQHDWAVNDAAFLMFRLAETYDEDLEDRKAAATILHQVVEQFPQTRHSANARHKLHEWGVA